MCIYKTRHKCVNYRISTLCDRCKISTKLQSNNNNNKNNKITQKNYSKTTFVLFFELGFEFPSCRWVRSLFALAELAALPPTPRALEYILYIHYICIYLYTISICIVYAWLLRVISQSLTERNGSAIRQSIESVMYVYGISIMAIGPPLCDKCN